MTPEEAKQRREYEIAETQLLQMFPRLWWRLYEKNIEEGFSETQAFQIVLTYIKATMQRIT